MREGAKAQVEAVAEAGEGKGQRRRNATLRTMLRKGSKQICHHIFIVQRGGVNVTKCSLSVRVCVGVGVCVWGCRCVCSKVLKQAT